MNVLVIPEDFRKDQYILKPIIEAMMSRAGGAAKVRVCQDPLLGGVSQAMKWERIEEIIIRYMGMIHLFLLCVDRDGVENRKKRLTNIERRAAEILSKDRRLMAENAWQEIEVWVLAGHKAPSNWRWRDVRMEPNPKEMYFMPFAKGLDLLNEPGEGRKTLALDAARRYKTIRRKCPELAGLEKRVSAWMEEL